MNPPKVVVFDLGKVLLDFDYAIAARKLVRRPLEQGDISLFLAQMPTLLRYETGLMTHLEFHGAICEATGFAGNLEEFSNCFADIFTEITPMVELHRTLRARGVPTYIFSNTNDLAIRHIRRNFPFFQNFDGYVFSYQHHAMKPDPKLYEVVEHECGHCGQEILYLDDRPENIATGAARGWQVVLHETPEKSLMAITRLGLLDGAA